MLARMKTMLAMISCSPPRRPVAPWPCQGETGESIQMSRGMHAIRLIAMELGRVMDRFLTDRRGWVCAGPTLAFCHSETGVVVKGWLGVGRAVLSIVSSPLSVVSGRHGQVS